MKCDIITARKAAARILFLCSCKYGLFAPRTRTARRRSVWSHSPVRSPANAWGRSFSDVGDTRLRRLGSRRNTYRSSRCACAGRGRWELALPVERRVFRNRRVSSRRRIEPATDTNTRSTSPHLVHTSLSQQEGPWKDPGHIVPCGGYGLWSGEGRQAPCARGRRPATAAGRLAPQGTRAGRSRCPGSRGGRSSAGD